MTLTVSVILSSFGMSKEMINITGKCGHRPHLPLSMSSVIICTLSLVINGGAQCLLSSYMPVEEPLNLEQGMQ